MLDHRPASALPRRSLHPHLASVTGAWLVALCLLVAGAVIGAVLDSRVYLSDELPPSHLPGAAAPISRALDPSFVREDRDDEAAARAASPAG
jgi:hypothetical protein